jgi:hypothetical protein
MAVLLIKPATITVRDLDSLLVAWREYGQGRLMCVFVLTGCPLTKTQLRRLPRELQRRLFHGTAVGQQRDIEELERIFRLDDSRQET